MNITVNIRDFLDTKNIQLYRETNGFKLSKIAGERTQEWGLPAYCLSAIMLWGLIENNKITIKELEELKNIKIKRLVEGIQSWHRLETESIEGDHLDVKQDKSQYYSLLRQHFRQIYIDYPNLERILCLIALRDVLLDTLESNLFFEFIRQVYIPIVEMLGLWNIRHKWLDKLSKIFIQNGYPKDELYKLTGACVAQINKILADQDQNAIIELKNITDELVSIMPDRNNIGQFTNLVNLVKRQQTILEEFRSRLGKYTRGINVEIKIRPLHLHKLLPLVFANSFLDGVENSLRVDVLCELEEDCYRLLGIVHGIGRPIAPRFTKEFRDYIADARENGYRALTTAIVIRHHKKQNQNYYQDSFSDNVLNIRILTPKMEKVNQWGVIEALYRNKEEYVKDRNYCHAWWHPLEHERLSKGLIKNYSSLKELLRSHDIGTLSEKLYVFTPVGQIKLMEKGSKPLDFAYMIHSELGDHARSIIVNGEIVDFGYPLRNGDIVTVNYDPKISGPDISWLGLTTSSKARYHIRSKLYPKDENPHKGKLALIKALEKTLIRYSQKGFSIGITNYRLETFLQAFVRHRKLDDLNQLYELIENQKISPYYIVQRFISEELAKSICFEDGAPLEIPTYRVLFCDRCHPIPPDPIVGLSKSIDPITGMNIHHRECECLRDPNLKKQRINLTWNKEDDESANKKLYEFHILGDGRFFTLGDILKCVEHLRIQNVHQIINQNNIESTSFVNLILSIPSYEKSRVLYSKLNNLRGVHQIWFTRISSYQVHPVIYRSHFTNKSANPFYERFVYGPLDFYDREEVIQDLLCWIKSPFDFNKIYLHGSRRIGKTSLAYHLSKYVLRNYDLAYPVYVDLTAFPLDSGKRFLYSLREEIFKKTNKSYDDNISRENITPLIFADEISSLSQRLEMPLLLILDEFDYVLQSINNQNSDLEVLLDIVKLMNIYNNVKWLFIVSDTVLNNNPLSGLIFGKMDSLRISELDFVHAERLIIDTAANSGVSFDTCVPTTFLDSQVFKDSKSVEGNTLARFIFYLSGGIPYYIKKLCYYAWDIVVNEKRETITFEDILRAKQKLVHYGRPIFDHFLRLGNVKVSLLKCVADLSKHSSWVSIKILKRTYYKHYAQGKSTFDEFENLIESLISQGFLEYKHDDISLIKLSVPLFGEFARNSRIEDLLI